MAKKKTAKKTSIADVVKDIADDAQALADALQPKATLDENLSQAELNDIKRLVKRSEDAWSESRKRTKERRKEEIEDLEELIESLDSALGVPGLDSATRGELKDLRRRRRSRLVRLRSQQAVDFAGILTAPQVSEIQDILATAKRDVTRKKKAAAFLSTLLRIADLGLTIAGKVAAAI